MCRQMHSKDRGVTHVVVQRGRKPEAERLPPGPSCFLLFCLASNAPKPPCCVNCLCSHRKSRYRVAHPTFAPRALRALDTAPRSATVSPNVRSTEGSGRRITVCVQRARLLRAGLARAALDTSASCRIARGLTQSSDRPAHPSVPKALVQVLQDEEGRPGKELVPHRVFL